MKLRNIFAATILALSVGTSAEAEPAKNEMQNIETPFSHMTSEHYEGYPLFHVNDASALVDYKTQGIYVRIAYTEWNETITYSVEEPDEKVTRSDHLTKSGCKIIRGTNNEPLFVICYSL